MVKKQTFQNSYELKRLFNQLFDAWSKKHRLTLGDLAERCGVSTQYLAHIARYGRIPGKPILILLAFNLEAPDPQALFRAAQVAGPWPYDESVGIRPKGAAESGFLSLHLDLPGFTSAIREIVRSELRPKSLGELLSGRPLRVGLNKGQTFHFRSKAGTAGEGFFPELMQLLALALHCELEFLDVPHAAFAERLRAGDIDAFGPVFVTPSRITQALYTTPFCTVAIGGLWRTAKAQSLSEFQPPRALADLRKREYRIAVHKESMSHHFAMSELAIPVEQLIVCDVPEEAVERILLKSIPRPAHVLLTDLPHAYQLHKEHGKATELLFSDIGREAAPYEDSIAVRPDWPSVVKLFDETLDFLRRNGSVHRLYERTIDDKVCPGITHV